MELSYFRDKVRQEHERQAEKAARRAEFKAKFRLFFKQLFCWHKWAHEASERHDWQIVYKFKCVKCGEIDYVSQ